MANHCSYWEMAAATPYTLIYPNLYMGSKKAIEHSDPGDFDIYVSMAAELTLPLEMREKFEFYHVPLNDAPWDFQTHSEELMKLISIARKLARRIRSGDNVLIFCNMGMNRSGLMAALILMHMGFPWRKALNTIRGRHGCTLSNDTFVRALPYAQRIISENL